MSKLKTIDVNGRPLGFSPSGIVGLDHGGFGGSTPEDARANIEAAALVHGHTVSNVSDFQSQVEAIAESYYSGTVNGKVHDLLDIALQGDDAIKAFMEDTERLAYYRDTLAENGDLFNQAFCQVYFDVNVGNTTYHASVVDIGGKQTTDGLPLITIGLREYLYTTNRNDLRSSTRSKYVNTWGSCSVKTDLNGSRFYNKLDSDLKAMLKKSKVQYYYCAGTESFYNTFEECFVFIPSYDELCLTATVTGLKRESPNIKFFKFKGNTPQFYITPSGGSMNNPASIFLRNSTTYYGQVYLYSNGTQAKDTTSSTENHGIVPFFCI